jgi:hypothetical protein
MERPFRCREWRKRYERTPSPTRLQSTPQYRDERQLAAGADRGQAEPRTDSPCGAIPECVASPNFMN